MLDPALGMVSLPVLAAGAAALVRLLVGSMWPESAYTGVSCPGGELGAGFAGALALGVVVPLILLVVGIGGTVRALAHGTTAWPWWLLAAVLAGASLVVGQSLWPGCSY